VIRAALDDHVAGSELYLRVVEHEVNFAVEHHRVVDSLGAMHERVVSPAAER